jgi:hypothetical protein
MKRRACVLGCLAVLLVCATSAGADAPRAYLVRDDFGSEPLYDCYLNYYYYVPCPTSSWFWAYSFEKGDIVGAWFEVGDPSMGGGSTCDPTACFNLERFRFLEFCGYANYPEFILPDYYRVDYDIYCADEYGCPVGPALWHNNTIPSNRNGWTYVDFDPPLSLCSCGAQPGGGARMLITVKAGGNGAYNICWAFDNISTLSEHGCVMHDSGCSSALYPRPANSHYSTMHSGYYGNGGFQYCPPQWIPDGHDTSGTEFGYVELCFRIYQGCTGPSTVEPLSWGRIKAMYR